MSESSYEDFSSDDIEFSEDEITKHQELVKKISHTLKIKQCNKRKRLLNESRTKNKHNVYLKSKISLEDLHSSNNNKDLKKKIISVQKSIPLNKNCERVNTFNKQKNARIEGFKKTENSLQKWNKDVKRNQNKNLCFYTKQSTVFKKPSLKDLSSKMNEKNNFSKDFNNLVKRLGYKNEKNTKSSFIEKAKSKSDAFLENIKNKRKKNIKSRSFRKRLRFEKLKKVEKLKRDGLDIEEENDRAFFKRARERMDLRHKNTGNWVKKVLNKPHHPSNKKIKESIAQKNKIEKELRKHLSDNEDDDFSGEKLIEETIEEVKRIDNNKKGIFALNFMKKALNQKATKVSEEETQNLNKLTKNNDVENNLSELNKSEGVIKFSGGSKKNNNKDKNENENNNLNKAIKTCSFIKNKKNQNKLDKYFQKKEFDSEEITSECSSVERDNEKIIDAGQNKENFLNEKNKLIDCKEKIVTQWGGWGSWAGIGMKKKIIKKKNIIKKPKIERKNLIVNQNAIDQIVSKITIQNCPKEFKSNKSYNDSLKKPLSKQWNDSSFFQKEIESKVLIKRGIEIEPLKQNDVL